MRCPKCGAAIANDSLFCSECGAKIEFSNVANDEPMSFSTAISTCFSKYCNSKGRATRAEYWWFYLFYMIIYIPAAIFDLSVIGYNVLTYIVAFAFLLPTISVAIRRYHDSNHSGWWILVPIANLVLLFYRSDEQPNEYDE